MCRYSSGNDDDYDNYDVAGYDDVAPNINVKKNWGETGQLDEPSGAGGEREQALPRLHAGPHHVHDPIQVHNDDSDYFEDIH